MRSASCRHGPGSFAALVAWGGAALRGLGLLQIRTQLAAEMTQDLSAVAEENAHLMRESIAASFSLDTVASSPFE